MLNRLISKVSLFAFVFILILTFSMLVGVNNSLSMQHLIAHLDGVLTSRLLRSSEFNTHMARAIRELQTYVLTDQDDEYEEAGEALVLAQEDIADIAVLQPRILSLITLNQKYDALNGKRQILLDKLRTLFIRIEGRNNVPEMFFDEIEQIEGAIEALSLESRQVLDEERVLVNALAEQSARQNFIVTVVGVVLPFGSSLIMLIAMQRGVVRPIRYLADASLAFAQGDHQTRLTISNHDEIGMLQRSFNTLFDTISQQTRLLTEQAQVADTIRAQARAAQQLADAVAEQNALISAQAATLQAEISERQIIEASLIQARDAAQDANRAKSTFLATMSHELRTPLTAILGFSELADLLLTEGNVAAAQRDLTYIQSAGKHLLTLIEDILDLSRIEAGRLTLTCSSFTVATLVDEVVQTVKPLIDREQNTLTVLCAPAIDMMYSDATRVRQVLMNLLSNAAKFTKAGQITVSVEPDLQAEAPTLHFSVADTGIGIAANQMPRLFQAFTQLDDAATRKYGGAGLGLSLSQRLANLLGGTITATSEHGVGSVFTLTLPLTWEEEALSKSANACVLTAPGAGVATYPSYAAVADSGAVCDTIALCIDDDPAVGVLLQQLLQPANIAVVYAASGHAGLEFARDLQPDIILLDVLMPDLDGWQVLTQLKADQELAHIPVIMLSIDIQQQSGLTLGAVEYLVKPFQPQQLVDAVQHYCLRLPAGDHPDQRCALLIMDDQGGSDDLRRNLEGDGWSVVIATTPAGALESFTTHGPAIIVIDLALPDLNGVQMIEAMRYNRFWRGTPLIILAAAPMSAEEHRVLHESVAAMLEQGTYYINEVGADLQKLINQYTHHLQS